MSTLKEVIYNFKNIRARGNQSDDSKLSDHQVMFLIDQYRAKLIRQDYDKGKPLNPALIQDLGFLAVRPAVGAVNLGPIQGDNLYVTDLEVPRMVEATQENLWTHVGQNPMSLPFQRTTSGKIMWDIHSSYTKNLPKWFEHANRLYAYFPTEEEEKPLTELFAMGVAESPYSVLEFKREVNYEDPYEFEYPISATMLDSLYKMIADAEFKIMQGMKPDLSNDGNDE